MSYHETDFLDMPRGGGLQDHFLIAMPGLHGSIFAKTVIYICAHSDSGTMGIVINQSMPEIDFTELIHQLSPFADAFPRIAVSPPVHFGGPVDIGRGFVLHSTDFIRAETVRVNDHICITGTVDILQQMAAGTGPDKSIFALGYAGWGPGQLEEEIRENSWLSMPVDHDILFAPGLSDKWEQALARLGVTPAALSLAAGQA